MNKFPWNCGECPLLHTYDMSVDDLTYVCLWSKAQIDDCDRYESAECPLDKHDAQVRAEAIDEIYDVLSKWYYNSFRTALGTKQALVDLIINGFFLELKKLKEKKE